MHGAQVKLVVGPGGEKIKEIQKRAKVTVQILKTEKELERGRDVRLLTVV